MARLTEGPRTLLLYMATGAAYITLGVLKPGLLYASALGLGFLLLGVWILPAFFRRIRDAIARGRQ